MSEETTAVETVKVKFLRNVPYLGDGYKPGDTANLETEQAAWFVAEGHAEYVTDEEKPKGKSK